MFVGRESELIKLEKMYSTNEFQFAVIYGRRRVGKTTLIREFLKNKESLLYVSLEGTQKENLIGLSKEKHKLIHELYKDNKKLVQEELKEMKRMWEDRIGIPLG